MRITPIPILNVDGSCASIPTRAGFGGIIIWVFAVRFGSVLKQKLIQSKDKIICGSVRFWMISFKN